MLHCDGFLSVIHLFFHITLSASDYVGQLPLHSFGVHKSISILDRNVTVPCSPAGSTIKAKIQKSEN